MATDTFARTMAQAVMNRVTPFVFTPRQFGAIGDGIANDTAALQAAIQAASDMCNGTVDLGSGRYRVTAPIGTLVSNPITIRGDGPSQCWIIVDAALAGDVLSFSNCNYISETMVDMTGTTVTGNQSLASRWNGVSGRKSGVWLEGFTVAGDRTTANNQNGIVFYNRNDAVTMRKVEVECIRGIGLCLSGLATNPATNAASLLRESTIKDCQARWCGDWASGRPAVMLSCTSKTATQNGYLSDDANNYNYIEGLKIIFPEGVGLQSNCLNLSPNQMANNRVQVIVDSQRGMVTSPTYINGGSISSGFCSITGGVLTIAPGGNFTRNSGAGTGDLTVGTFVFNANVPPGTYIAAIQTGPGAGGAGSYQLANRQTDLSTLNVNTATMGSCRFTTPMIEIGGGHVGEDWDIVANGSATLGSNGTVVVYNQNPLNGSLPKTQYCHARMALGALDQGAIFTSINSLAVDLSTRSATVPVTVSLITQSVVLNLGGIVTSGEVQINGSMQNLHVVPGAQKVVYGTAIGSVLSANKWPNCEIYLNNAGALTRYVSVPASPNYSSCTWTAA